MFLSAVFKLQPTRAQHRALETALEQTRLLYNAALEERISAYRRGVRIRRFDQTRSLTEIRGMDELGWSRYPVALGRWPLRQLDEAYKAAFKRGQDGRPWSFPRFRSKARFRSFGLLSWSGARVEAGRIVIKGLGALRLHLHRAAPQNGDILGCTLTKRGRGWTVQLQMRTSPADPIAETPANRCALDWGLEHALTLHTGETISNPKIGARHRSRIRKAQRKLARARRGSRRRHKTRMALASLYQTLANARRSWLHDVSKGLVSRFAHIAVEDLKILNMTASATGTLQAPSDRARQKAGLNRSILDGAPGQLFAFLDYKTRRAGGSLKRFDPHGTSQACAACGARVPKTLAVRIHRCSCGFQAHRDTNAACNGYRRPYHVDAPLVVTFKTGGGMAPEGRNRADGPVVLETLVDDSVR